MSIYKFKNNSKAEVWIGNKRMRGKAGFVTKAEAKVWHDRMAIKYRKNPNQFVKKAKSSLR